MRVHLKVYLSVPQCTLGYPNDLCNLEVLDKKIIKSRMMLIFIRKKSIEINFFDWRPLKATFGLFSVLVTQ